MELLLYPVLIVTLNGDPAFGVTTKPPTPMEIKVQAAIDEYLDQREQADEQPQSSSMGAGE